MLLLSYFVVSRLKFLSKSGINDSVRSQFLVFLTKKTKWGSINLERRRRKKHDTRNCNRLKKASSNREVISLEEKRSEEPLVKFERNVTEIWT